MILQERGNPGGPAASDGRAGLRRRGMEVVRGGMTDDPAPIVAGSVRR
jgi:hypothetical protein